MESTVVMLHTAKLPTFLWEYALKFACHVYNRRAHPALPNGITPIEALLRIKPSVKYLRAFGCLAWAKTKTQGRDKQLSRSDPPGRLIAYSTDTFGMAPNGYILYYPGENRISNPVRDVLFDEQTILEACRESATEFS